MKLIHVEIDQPKKGLGILALNGTGEYLLSINQKVSFDLGVVVAVFVTEDGTGYTFMGKDDFLYTEWL